MVYYCTAQKSSPGAVLPIWQYSIMRRRGKNIDTNAKADDGTTALIQIASSFAVKTRRLK